MDHSQLAKQRELEFGIKRGDTIEIVANKQFDLYERNFF